MTGLYRRTLLVVGMWVVVVVVGMWAVSPTAACAQERGQGRQETAPVQGGAEGEPGADVDAEAEVVEEEGGRRVTVIRFSGLDISGELKSPQLLYFLARLRAEFDRPRLPHRSFLPDLVRSSQGDGF